ncbi:MAG: hypothetical protein JXP72_05770 [Coriobacteriia bacterium]|nr:hypothetical protein [Coriobacteriia bacterium]
MAQPLKSVRIARRVTVVAAITAASLFAASVASSAPAPGTPDAIVDNETVYVVADATGVPQTVVVVDWLQVQGTGTYELTDPAAGAGEIESLTDGFSPAIIGDVVGATVAVDGYGDFFYRAETEQALPIDINVTYQLDGEEIAPADLAGESGRLRIQIEVVNHLERTELVTFEDADGATESAEVTYTVPLLCIPQLELDGTRMTDIVAPDGAQLAIAGQTRTYAIPVVPSPRETVAIEMTARDIELAPMIVSAFPGLPASPDFSVVDQLAELRDGLGLLGQLSSGHLQVVQGISEGMGAYDISAATGAAEGLGELTTGLGELASGADGLAQLSAGQYAYLDGVITSIDTSQFDSLGQLTSAIASMTVAASQLETATAGLVTLLDGQIALAEAIRTSNAGLLAQAAGYADEYGAYSTDATALAAAGDFQTLAAGLGTQDHLLGVLLDGGDPDGPGPQPFMPGLHTTRDSLAQVRDGLTGLRGGLEQLEAGAAGLGAVPGAFGQLRAALVVLRDGGDPDGTGPAPHMPGLGTTADGIAGIADGLRQVADGLQGQSADLAMLAEVPEMMGELKAALDALAQGGTLQGQQLPGIGTTIEGLSGMSDGIGNGVTEARKGEALTEAMKRAADAYTSFLGLLAGATVHLSFLFKIGGVSAE